MSRSEGLAAWFLRVLRTIGGGARKRDNASVVRPSPGRRSGRPPPDESEAVILNWLEDGEEVEDEEKYWRKPPHHEKPAPAAKVNKVGAVGQEPNNGAASDETGMAGAVLAGESATEDQPGSEAKTRLRRALSILSDLVDVVHSFFKSLRVTDWLLLGAVVVLLLVVVMMVFPVTLTWGKAVVRVWKWPFWVWTCILVLVFGYLAWLRSRQE